MWLSRLLACLLALGLEGQTVVNSGPACGFEAVIVCTEKVRGCETFDVRLAVGTKRGMRRILTSLIPPLLSERTGHRSISRELHLKQDDERKSYISLLKLYNS